MGEEDRQVVSNRLLFIHFIREWMLLLIEVVRDTSNPTRLFFLNPSPMPLPASIITATSIDDKWRQGLVYYNDFFTIIMNHRSFGIIDFKWQQYGAL